MCQLTQDKSFMFFSPAEPDKKELRAESSSSELKIKGCENGETIPMLNLGKDIESDEDDNVIFQSPLR